MSLEKVARVLVAGAVGQQSVAREQPARVGVGHEHRPARRVQQDGVDGFGTESSDPEHLAPERGERRAAHALEATAETLQQPAGEGLEPARHEPVRAGGADDLGQLGLFERGQALGIEQPACAQGRHRVSGVDPGGVLGQDRSHGDLEGRAGRPPALRSVATGQRHVEPQQPRLRRIRRRPRDLSPAEHA
jgi:hypothetical protein